MFGGYNTGDFKKIRIIYLIFRLFICLLKFWTNISEMSVNWILSSILIKFMEFWMK